MTEIKVAGPDDYLHVAGDVTDWSRLPDHVSVDFSHAPLPADHPLRSLPNTVLMPHVAGFTREHYTHWYDGMRENVAAWLDGNPIDEIEAEGVVAVRVEEWIKSIIW